MEIRFGILKTARTSVLKAPASMMVETLELTGEGHLLCTTTDTSDFQRMTDDNLEVTLKYIQKPEGLFIKLTGFIVSSNKTIAVGSSTQKSHPNNSTNNIVIKIRINDVHVFKKRSTSPYTSFLQSLSALTGNVQLSQAG